MMIDAEGDPEATAGFVRDTVRRAAKVYRCRECGEKIPRGEQYQHTAGVWGGRWSTVRVCLGCADIRSGLFVGCWDYGELYQELTDAEVLTGDPVADDVLAELTPVGREKIMEQWRKRCG